MKTKLSFGFVLPPLHMLSACYVRSIAAFQRILIIVIFPRVTTRSSQPPRLSKISVLFFQEHLFLDFSRMLYYVFTKQIPTFQEDIWSVHRTDTDSPGAPFLLSNRYRFSRSTVLATEQGYRFYRNTFSATYTDEQI